MAKASKVPTRIAKDVRVVEKKREGRSGTVIKAIGQAKWEVQFDGSETTEEKTSNQLQIYKSAYGVTAAKSPIKSAARTIRKSIRSTIKKKNHRKQQDSDSDDDGSDSTPSDDETTPAPPRNRFHATVSSVTSSMSRLLTPRELMSPSPGRRLFDAEDDSPSASDGIYNPEEGDDDNDLEEEEDDNGRGTAHVFADGNGGERVEFIDKPQAADKYRESKRIMEREKERLIRERKIFEVELKTKNSYVFLGRVQGRAQSNTIFSGEKGTIVDMISDKRFRVKWDNESISECEAKKSDLKLIQNENSIIEWKVVREHDPENVPTPYTADGVIGFSFNSFNILDRKSPDYSHPFARLLELLWPKDSDGNGWREQLQKVNAELRERDAADKKNWKEMDEDEWWTFWGIIIYAGKLGKGGAENLYDNSEPISDLLPNTKVNLSGVMKKYRLQQLISVIPHAFHGKDVDDPWNAITSLVDGFNNTRAQKIAASYCKIFDESMSAWSPTTTRFGGLPFLSFILRKPQPLGTEFKVVACSKTGEFFVSL